MSILQKIKGHDDLTALDDRQRTQLCGEIREFLVSNVSKTGGHLAGNLGVVELSVAIETVFNTEIDRLVFVVSRIESVLPYPVFIKPANAGSSCGVSIFLH